MIFCESVNDAYDFKLKQGVGVMEYSNKWRISMFVHISESNEVKFVIKLIMQAENINRNKYKLYGQFNNLKYTFNWKIYILMLIGNR